jgi:hypothetical protein
VRSTSGMQKRIISLRINSQSIAEHPFSTVRTSHP